MTPPKPQKKRKPRVPKSVCIWPDTCEICAEEKSK